jgi:hypothetical protein
MEPDLEQQFEDVEVDDMIMALKSIFEASARMGRCNVSQALLGSKLRDVDPIRLHVIKMVVHTISG